MKNPESKLKRSTNVKKPKKTKVKNKVSEKRPSKKSLIKVVFNEFYFMDPVDDIDNR